MSFDISTDQDYFVYQLRRQELCARLKEAHPQASGRVLLFGAFGAARGRFVQESSFYYLTGLTEPGLVALIDADGKLTVYQPQYPAQKLQWEKQSLLSDKEYCKQLQVSVQPLGNQSTGLTLSPYAERDVNANFINTLHSFVSDGGPIFVCVPQKSVTELGQHVLFERCAQWVPGFEAAVVDVAPIIVQMRRTKDAGEIEMMTRAVDVTVVAHEAAMQAISAGTYECEVQASIEFAFTASGAMPAFNTIVASGKNATILHYDENDHELEDGDLVVIDCGARYEGYCADVTRTYPVSKKFNARQKKVYELVLAAQELVVSKAMPGFYLNNDQEPEKSLTHIARAFFKKHDCEQYFAHGIGHFVGLDVHDVGDVQKPLQEGDVITLEPGLYLPEESLGVRIEDMYWITQKGAVCLTDYLPKKIAEIEMIMSQVGAEDSLLDDEDDCSGDCDDCGGCCH